LFGLYHSLWRYASINELVKLVLATTLAFILNIGLSHLMKWDIPRSITVISYILTVMGVSLSRLSYRYLRRVKSDLRPKDNLKRVLVVGAGDAGATIIKELKISSHAQSQPIAIVDDASWKQHTLVHGVRVKGKIKDIEEVVVTDKIDEIIIAIPSLSKEKLKEIVAICQRTKCTVKTLPHISEMSNQKAELSTLRQVDIVDLLGRNEVTLDISGIKQFIENQVVLITGGGGSIGSEICRQLIKFNPSQLLILDIYENNAYDLHQALKRQYPDKDIKVIIASVRDKERLCHIFKEYKPSIVFHAAAHKHVPFMEDHPSEAIKNNVMGTLNVALCAHENDVKRFILISTDKAVNPTNIMGATKRVAELIIQSLNQRSNTEFVAVRFGNVLGSNGSVIPLFKAQIQAGGPVTVTHPDITRYFMTIPEASRLVIQAGAIAKGGEIFVLDMGEPVKIVDLAKQIITLSGYTEEQIPIEFVGLRPGEKLYEELLLEEEGLACTQQEGIMIAKPSDITFEEVYQTIQLIRENQYDIPLLKHSMKRLVPSMEE
jgi:FlaA1/EpsC-like NDP-sugar epimerase